MYNDYKKKQRWFSLTEIILVVSILMILGSIAISAYSVHTRTARDASRIKQSQEVADAFDIYAVSKKLPQPEDAVDVLVNGTLVWYQWYASEEILARLNFFNGGLDPLDRNYKNRRKKNPYTYYLTKDLKNAQLLVFLEDSSNIISFLPEAHAADYSNRIPKVSGKKLGVLTHNTLNTPIQEIDTIRAAGELDIGITTNFYTAHISDDRKITGNFNQLAASTPFASCRRIAESWKRSGWNKMYRINPDGNEYIDVYCDMDIANGWWMLIGSKSSAWDQEKWNLWTVRVTEGSNANVSIPNDQILNWFTEAMACSSENCWKWDMSDVFRECIRSNCYTPESDINNLVRVKWTSWFSLWTTDTIKYNDASSLEYMFSLYNTGTSFSSPALWAWSDRVDADWDGTWSWWVRDQWHLYIR